MTTNGTTSAHGAKPAREQHTRTVCACDVCRLGCHHMPGVLAVGDLERIADYTGHDPSDAEWAAAHFAASDGTKVGRRGEREGEIEIITIPTIVPQQAGPDGHCTFLGPDGRCTIHPAAPYGCSHFDTHMTAAEANARMRTMLIELCEPTAGAERYAEHWETLARHGAIATHIRQRKTAYAEAAQAAAQTRQPRETAP